MTHNDISDAEIEAVARAMAGWNSADPFAEKPLDEPNADDDREWWRERSRAAILASRAALLAEERKVVAREPLIEMCDAATLSTSAFLALENQGIRGVELRRLKHTIRFLAMWDAAP